MSSLKKEIEKLKDIFNHVLVFLNEMNDENLRYNLEKAKVMMQNAHYLRKELLSGFEIEELKYFDDDLSKITKQVSDKFDNIITNKRLELEIVSKKLILMQNQKKLINYSR